MPIDSLSKLAVAHVNDRSTGGAIDRSARIVLHFHPDAPFGEGTVLRAIARDGLYRSQFETGTSNGGLTAIPGGERWGWETDLFGGLYDGEDPGRRPKYGALNQLNDPYGAAPRFGSSYLRLAEPALDRSTFCYPDSHYGPTHFGTATKMGLLDAARIAPQDDPLDRYVEAHVHGPIDVSTDVEAIVLDPSYRGTGIEEDAQTLGCAVEWHPGYSLAMNDSLDPEYRGQRILDLACAIGDGAPLTPRLLGTVRAVGRYDPQDLKKVWHYLARYGRA
jgi:hypothetical protein